MRIDILTLFPGMLAKFWTAAFSEEHRRTICSQSMFGTFAASPRINTTSVDDIPYGGGGMVMKPDVAVACIEHIKVQPWKSDLLPPQGTVLIKPSRKPCQGQSLVLLCGHYEV